MVRVPCDPQRERLEQESFSEAQALRGCDLVASLPGGSASRFRGWSVSDESSPTFS